MVQRPIRTVILVLLLSVFLAGGFLFFGVVPREVADRENPILNAPPYEVSSVARDLHQRLFIADLHADSLLWKRDLLQYGDIAHIDVPRLIAANSGLQVFPAVTQVPRDRNYQHTPADRFDMITLLAIAQRWPVNTWASRKERALYQSRKLHDFADGSEGHLVIIKTRQDLERYLETRARNRDMVAGMLALEGAHCLDGRLQGLDELFGAGFRMLGLVHHFDNRVGGSAHGEHRGGLTAFGEAVIMRAEKLQIVLDLAHASPRLVDDVLDRVTRPVVVSHTGVKGTCDNPRNLTDRQIRGIAASGGVIGIGYFPAAVCGSDAGAVVRAIRYTVNLVGIDHVALGSDFDGSVTTPFDVTGLPQITQALVEDGFSEAEIARIMGGNVIRLLLASLPDE